MSDHHRYEELAVGHVLGGLDAVDQAEFRSHLLGCRHCRTRVAELRDIASSMEAAEREERAATRVKMEVVRREEDEPVEDGEPLWARITLRGASVALLVIVTLIGLLLWNFHLRDVNETLLETTAAREAVLTLLASGEPVPVASGTAGVVGVASQADDEVAVDLAGLPAARPDEWLGVWFLDADGTPTVYLPYAPVLIDAGVFAAVLDTRDADTIVFTLERGEATGRTAPDGQRLAVLDLGG